MNRIARVSLALAAMSLASATVQAGGGPENVILVIDPANLNSQYVGHYYRTARDIPEESILYMPPRAASFADQDDFQLAALRGTLNNLKFYDHAGYVVIPPCGYYYVPASGLVSDGCSPVTRFALSSCYTMARIAGDVLDGTSHDHINEYAGLNDTAIAFDGNTGWDNGAPSTSITAPRYFIGALLGYDGERGNTIEEIIDLIDRSVAVDGTRPDGTFYFMRTTDSARSAPRDPFFQAAVDAIVGEGGSAVLLDAVLPEGNHDLLGVMTGWADPDIDGADMTILPGAFCDHMTSFAGNFESSSQVKLSRWISKGASGSHGAVEEPCNYAGKFPHARLHVYYYKGLSLGEAALRSLAYVPFQGLIYGDPLTRPFAYIPAVDVPDAPIEPVTGTLTLTPEATTDHPTAGIAGYDLYVDGRVLASAAFGESFEIDTTAWSDGAHDVRVVAYEDSDVATQGRWLGTIYTDNHGRSVEATVTPATGDLSTTFEVEVAVLGGSAAEIRLLCGGRVVAGASGTGASWSIPGVYLGAGPMRVQAVAAFADGSSARSERVAIDIDPSNDPAGGPGSAAPVAYGHGKFVGRNEPMLIELPASDADASDLTFTITAAPAKGTLEGTGATRLYKPNEDVTGSDSFSFTASDGAGTSNTATVTIEFGFRAGDADGDGDVDLFDVALLQGCWTGTVLSGMDLTDLCEDAFDWAFDHDVDSRDYREFYPLLTGPA